MPRSKIRRPVLFLCGCAASFVSTDRHCTPAAAYRVLRSCGSAACPVHVPPPHTPRPTARSAAAPRPALLRHSLPSAPHWLPALPRPATNPCPPPPPMPARRGHLARPARQTPRSGFLPPTMSLASSPLGGLLAPLVLLLPNAAACHEPLYHCRSFPSPFCRFARISTQPTRLFSPLPAPDCRPRLPGHHYFLHRRHITLLILDDLRYCPVRRITRPVTWVKSGEEGVTRRTHRAYIPIAPPFPSSSSPHLPLSTIPLPLFTPTTFPTSVARMLSNFKSSSQPLLPSPSAPCCTSRVRTVARHSTCPPPTRLSCTTTRSRADLADANPPWAAYVRRLCRMPNLARGSVFLTSSA
ncbi:hypothetical protein B0H16DRAFT_1897796 [Mycena metata]|uniref:Uncharacterized protein n=1 Tax=Mycena metata TaxID=1033252 RepID=A0AAD7MHM3_9AGAR|nr:hypothetical protein B0H16DRAFT_1897796 [Mycena metata]